MAYLVAIVVAFLLGIAVGRWWALLAAVALGVWIGVVEEVEVPGWFLGVGYTVVAAGGIAAGVALRKALTRQK